MFDPVDWLHSNQPALIAGLALKPRPQGRNLVLAASMGQAKVYYLDSDRGEQWLLKKFHPGRSPDSDYVEAVQRLVPHEAGFESGFQRRCLDRSMVAAQHYATAEFLDWMEGTVLMPQVIATEWSGFLANVSAGQSDLTLEERLEIAEALCRKVLALETAGLAHRDLSASNVMIDAARGIHLIDWDSLYASSLTMPPNTTFGTDGYVAPFVKAPEDTWRVGGDRFALTVLILETFAIEKDSVLQSDGSLLDQNDLRTRTGASIQTALAAASSRTSGLATLYATAFAAASVDACSAPEDWLRALKGIRRRQLRTAPAARNQKFVSFDRSRLVPLDRSRFVPLHL